MRGLPEQGLNEITGRGLQQGSKCPDKLRLATEFVQGGVFDLADTFAGDSNHLGRFHEREAFARLRIESKPESQDLGFPWQQSRIQYLRQEARDLLLENRLDWIRKSGIGNQFLPGAKSRETFERNSAG